MLDMDFSNVPKNEVANLYRNVSLKVKYFRENKNMTQLDLALEIGIKSVAFYSNCENNKYGKHFNLEHLYKIAKALDMKIEDFL
ncbi:MAG: helix-turn-helix transcriptional regulator [Sulfurimonas sp.]|jgi:DNA-binding XRE family transcriptional regulator|nr:helix-turn-helix transcriptional regulator [Sulfurimonas sp.]